MYDTMATSNKTGDWNDLMTRGSRSEGLPEGTGQRGLWRLMLRLPAVRGQLQVLVPRTEALSDLCEAYEDANVTLERLRNMPGEDNCPRVREYETICTEIESEVIQYCLEHRSAVPH
jgi:hypothetical protein